MDHAVDHAATENTVLCSFLALFLSFAGTR